MIFNVLFQLNPDLHVAHDKELKCGDALLFLSTIALFIGVRSSFVFNTLSSPDE